MRYKLRSGISFSSGPLCAGLLIAIVLRSSPGMMMVGMSVVVEALIVLAFSRTEERMISSRTAESNTDAIRLRIGLKFCAS